MPLTPELPLIRISSRREWRSWLERHHESSVGVWAITAKKAHVPADQEYVSARDLNEECLCFGWIDSKPGRVDDEHTALLCTPRKPGSSWSQVNKERFAVLYEQGLVAPAGEQVAQAAQADGSWNRLARVDALEEPTDLAKALDGDTLARAHWDAFPPSARRGILEWILNAKRASTRAGRIEETVAKAARNERAQAWKPRSG